jgi:hypothetical protein
MSQKSKWDYLKAIYSRYQKVSKPLRARILDEFCQVCGYNRKYAIRLLNGPAPQKPKTNPKGRRPTYGLKVILSLTAIWEAAGYPCSARLKALLPLWLPWAQKRFAISAQAQTQLLSITPATIDRRLKPKKRRLKNRLYGRTKPGTLLKVGPLEVGVAPFRTAHIYVYQPCLRELRSEETQSTAKPFWLGN